MDGLLLHEPASVPTVGTACEYVAKGLTPEASTGTCGCLVSS